MSIFVHQNFVLLMSKFTRLLRSIWRIPYVHHPLIALLLLVVLVFGAFLSLSIFTRHGD